jgi:hypothetical protein
MIRGREFEEHVLKSNGFQSSVSEKKSPLLISYYAGFLESN